MKVRIVPQGFGTTNMCFAVQVHIRGVQLEPMPITKKESQKKKKKGTPDSTTKRDFYFCFGRPATRSNPTVFYFFIPFHKKFEGFSLSKHLYFINSRLLVKEIKKNDLFTW